MYCVIPAAGRGVRFNELGKNYPKCVLPYQEVPIIVHNIRLALNSGAREVCIVIGHQGEKIREIVGMYFPDDSRIRFADYQEAAGKGGPGVSIYCGIPQDIGEEPILILLSDIVVEIEEFLPSDTSWISVQRVPDWERWCMVEIGVTVKKFHDKPKDKPPTDLAVSGIYYFTNASRFRFCMIDAIHGTREGEVQISSAMSRYMKDHEIVTPSFKIIDFGTLEEYLQNRGIKNSRSFNNLKSDWNGSTIVKSSETNAAKIHAEVNWYENLPISIKIMTPRIFNKNLYNICPSYTMERIDSPTLRELYLYLESDPKFWSDVFDKLFNVTDQFKQFFKPGKSQFFKKIATKNYERYAQINPKLANQDDFDFLSKFASMADSGELDIFLDSLYHGDLCFSNIFYHPGSKQIKLIDPRGEAYGNILYDLAKITHSAYYPYDYVDAELYLKKDGRTVYFDAGKEKVREAYKNLFVAKYGEETWRKTLFLTASLFLSMIPLHDHSETNQELYYALYRQARTDAGLV